MHVRTYGPELLPGIVSLYNDTVAGLPHCYAVSGDEMRAAFEPEAESGATSPKLSRDEAFVAVEEGEPIAVVHAAVEQREEEADRGVVRFACYRRGHRVAAQATLAMAEKHLAAQGVGEVIAFHQDYRYPFYHMGHAYLSDRLDHVHALMGMNGYERCAGEIYLDWRDCRPPEVFPPDDAVSLAAEWSDGAGELPNLTLLAELGGQELGECVCKSAGEFSAAPEAQEWFLTKWLGIEEPFRGQRWGQWLLAQALAEMVNAGYRHACISTSWTNFRACLFYSNFGYRASDWTYALSKRLQ